MPDEITPADEAVLQRRRFLRGSALLAAAAGGAVVATATSAVPASAADGEAVLAGESVSSASTTTLTLDPGSSTDAALTLTNPTGPALQLTPVTGSTTATTLPVGSLAANADGLLVGVRRGGSTATAQVLTTYDLQGLPVTISFLAGRVLNTKDDATRSTIAATSSGAFDSKGRLKKGAWMDVALLPTDLFGLQVDAAHLTLTALGSTSSGSLVTCPPGDKPAKVATLPFDKGRTVATGTYVATGEVSGSVAVRIYASATTHVKLDVTGLTILIDFDASTGPEANVEKVARSAQEKVAKHVQQVSARARLV